MTTLIHTPVETAAAVQHPLRSIGELLAPLNRIAEKSPNLIAKPAGRFEQDGRTYELPRYLFVGPKGGDEPIRIGIFAAIQGVLSAPPRLKPSPFEIVFETPCAAPQYQQENALVVVLQTILTEYRKFIAYAPNL